VADPPVVEPPAGPPPAGASPTGRGSDTLAFGSRAMVGAFAVILLAVVIITAVLALRDDDKDRKISATQTTASSTTAAPAAVTKCKKITGVPKARGKPTDISVPDKPVTKLVKKDLKKGKGATATDGKQLTVQYVGISCASGRQFDASWDRNQPVNFALGGQVIPGWNEGIKGMKVGGRRLLWIPASLGYGDQGSPPDIAPNDTLIFVVDLVKVG
jgi:peptidylprolyl isomerase